MAHSAVVLEALQAYLTAEGADQLNEAEALAELCSGREKARLLIRQPRRSL